MDIIKGYVLDPETNTLSATTKEPTLAEILSITKKLLKMKPVRAIVINPITCKVTEESIEPTLQELYRVINCTMIEASYSGAILKDSHFLYVDEEGMLKPTKHFFFLQGSTQPLAGIGILLRTDGDGNDIDCKLDIEVVRKSVTFYTEQDIHEILTGTA